MKSTAPYPLLASIKTWIIILIALSRSVNAFVPSRSSVHPAAVVHQHYTAVSTRLKSIAPNSDEPSDDGRESDSVDNQDAPGSSSEVPNDLGLEIIRGSASDISEETWGNIEGGAPSRWMVMKDLLGINIFTYILAAFIIFFLSMNAAFGPGWLGQSLGWEDVGTFTRTSDSLPLDVDVSRPDYLL
mmetsp:Transcript_1548/g.3954  ORF Transcript_1548/g.3954 Transcript_1548/m.3954 type:complete len:186 (-) Transcript_1548:1638-2195(-)